MEQKPKFACVHGLMITCICDILREEVKYAAAGSSWNMRKCGRVNGLAGMECIEPHVHIAGHMEGAHAQAHAFRTSWPSSQVRTQVSHAQCGCPACLLGSIWVGASARTWRGCRWPRRGLVLHIAGPTPNDVRISPDATAGQRPSVGGSIPEEVVFGLR